MFIVYVYCTCTCLLYMYIHVHICTRIIHVHVTYATSSGDHFINQFDVFWNFDTIDIIIMQV